MNNNSMKRFSSMGREFLRVNSMPTTFQKRHFGITDTIMKMATNKVEDNKDKQFGKMVEMMVQTPKWTLKPWKQTMESQLSSWTMYIPGVGSSDEVKNIKKFKSILDAMTVSELDAPESINGIAKERIAKATTIPVEDISRMLFFFKHSLVMHTWLKMKQAAGEPLPTTEGEIMEMQENDARIQDITRKIMVVKKTGRGRKMPF